MDPQQKRSELDFIVNMLLPSIVAGGGSGAVTFKYFGNRLIAHRLSKDLEYYKSELSKKTDGLKTQLAIFAHEQNVATSRVDAQKAEAIHAIYTGAREIVNPPSSIIAGTPIRNGTPRQSVEFYNYHAEQAHAAGGLLANRLSDLAIYFDIDTYQRIFDLTKRALTDVATFLQSLRKGISMGISYDELLVSAESERTPLIKGFNETIQPQLTASTDVFRDQMGIEERNNPRAGAPPSY